MKETNADHFKINLSRKNGFGVDDLLETLDMIIHEAVVVNGLPNKTIAQLDQLCNALTGAMVSMKAILAMHLQDTLYIPPEPEGEPT